MSVELFISAPWRSSGKSMLTMGLARAACLLQLSVQTFKKGPDYIDPLWLTAASTRPCFNLDPYLQSDAELADTFDSHLGEASVVLVEGTMGLHDGLQSDGSDSNAAIAKRLNLPVLLIVDCRGMHRTVAALINGVHAFDPELAFAGVILNRVRSSRHGQKLDQAVREHTDLTLFGLVPEAPHIRINEKSLGLVPAPEHQATLQHIDGTAALLEQHCDLDSVFKTTTATLPSAVRAATIVTAAQSSNTRVDPVQAAVPQPDLVWPDPVQPAIPRPTIKSIGNGLVIGIARDAAFHFYYQDDLDTLVSRGVELIEISPMTGTFPANLHGLIIGGGFPERHVQQLAANQGFRAGLLKSIEAGLVVHAECAGLMYLCRSIQLDDTAYPMVGAIAGDVALQDSPLGRGYMRLRCQGLAGESGTPGSDCNNRVIAAHEFHHSKASFDYDPDFVYRVERGYGVDGQNDGIRVKNVIATYAHLRHTKNSPWVDWFLDRIVAATTQQGAQTCLK